MEDSNKSNDKPWLFKKGNPGGPGRPRGKSLKEYSREYLASMTEEERQDFLEGIPKESIWKMAEGNPHSTADSAVVVTLPTPILGGTNEVPSNNSPKEDTGT